MKKETLSLFEQTGAFLMKVSVFAFLCANMAQAQQWQDSAPDFEQPKAQPPAAARPMQKITFGKPAPNVQMKPATEKHQADRQDGGKISIYMRDFKISQNLSGITSCSMSFYVESTLSSPISNISFRLKWPDLETPLSFDNIEAGRYVKQNHAFAGKVCYKLDQNPNVIVNRCRVKGMTQQDCANHIEWVK